MRARNQCQPLITMGGDHVFNQEFFDNVRVPARIRGAENAAGTSARPCSTSNAATSPGRLVTALRNDISKGEVHACEAGLGHRLKRVRNELADRASRPRSPGSSPTAHSIQKRGGVPNYEAL